MGNRQSIGIEICEYAGINQEKANDNGLWLIKLMKEFNILLANIVPHQKWSGKECPHKMLPIWDSFIKKIGEEGGSATMPTLKNGDQGTLVSQLQTDLNKLGYGLVVDGPLVRQSNRQSEHSRRNINLWWMAFTDLRQLMH